MAKNVSLKPVKASISKPNDRPPPCNKTLVIDPYNGFYEIEEGDKTEEVKEA